MSDPEDPAGSESPSRKQRDAERERTLVDRSVRGDADAFGAIYDLFVDDIYRYFYSHLGSPHDAEDLVSRTFLRTWRAIGNFKWRGRPFEAWLFTLARNQLMDFYRERRAPTATFD